MLTVIDYSREDARPAVYGVIDPEFAYCVEVGITGADLYWERELQLIEDELARIEFDNTWQGEFAGVNPQETLEDLDGDLSWSNQD